MLILMNGICLLLNLLGLLLGVQIRSRFGLGKEHITLVWQGFSRETPTTFVIQQLGYFLALNEIN